MSSSSLVLITGASGFVGSEIALEALREGHTVRLVFRQQAQADAWNKQYFDTQERTQIAIIPDFAAEGAFDQAIMEGVFGVVHAASPVVFDFEDNERDCLAPAKEGVLAVLRAAKKSATVKRVVLTSSIVSFFNVLAPPPKDQLITEKDWANLDYQQVLGFPREMGRVTYFASKYFAEKAAWEFMEAEKPTFTLTTIAPTFVLGYDSQANLSLSNLNGSYAYTALLLDAAAYQPHPIGSFVNVLDVARSHIKALSTPAAEGHRYLLVAGPFNDEQIGEIAMRAVPEQKGRWPPLPDGGAPEAVMPLSFDSAKAEKDFGFKYIGLEETIQNYAKQLLSLPAS